MMQNILRLSSLILLLLASSVYGAEQLTESQRLRQQAETALTDGNYKQAISTLTKLLNKGSLEHRPFAIEYLGVAREKNRQLAFAKQYYQQFLSEYPDSEHSGRVKARLDALIGIQTISNQKKLKAGSGKSSRSTNYTRGSISADYRRSELVDDNGDQRTTISLASVYFDVQGHYQLQDSSIKIQFSGGHYEDFRDEDSYLDASNDRLRYATVGWESNDKTYSADIGRMRSRGKGIFGRFDGLVLGYGVTDKQKLNFTMGYPVASTKELSVDPERVFVGLSYDWQDLFEDFDISLFALNQTIDDLTDRQAVGGEFKYSNQGVSIFGLIDYDLYFSELNALMFSGSYVGDNSMRYNWAINQRKSPYISTRNALVGQASDSIEELQETFFTDDEIFDSAVDRTLESTTATFQVSKPLNETFDLSSSITWMDISGAPESGGVAEIVDTDGQIYFNIYLGAKQLYSDNDSSQIGIRVSNLATSDVWSIFANSQYKLSQAWKIKAKLRYDDRLTDNGSEQQNISPGIRLQYQDKSHYFYTEAGAIFYTNQSALFDEISTDIYYLYLGYRYYF